MTQRCLPEAQKLSWKKRNCRSIRLSIYTPNEIATAGRTSFGRTPREKKKKSNKSFSFFPQRLYAILSFRITPGKHTCAVVAQRRFLRDVEKPQYRRVIQRRVTTRSHLVYNITSGRALLFTSSCKRQIIGCCSFWVYSGIDSRTRACVCRGSRKCGLMPLPIIPGLLLESGVQQNARHDIRQLCPCVYNIAMERSSTANKHIGCALGCIIHYSGRSFVYSLELFRRRRFLIRLR